jgi:hypothetical protein
MAGRVVSRKVTADVRCVECRICEHYPAAIALFGVNLFAMSVFVGVAEIRIGLFARKGLQPLYLPRAFQEEASDKLRACRRYLRSFSHLQSSEPSLPLSLTSPPPPPRVPLPSPASPTIERASLPMRRPTLPRLATGRPLWRCRRAHPGASNPLRRP